MRSVRIRIDVLRNNVKVTELACLSAPSITASTDSEIKSSLSGEFAPNSEVNWYTDELRPVVTIDDVDYPFGVYSPATYEFSNDGVESTVRIEAYDRCWLAKTKCLTSIAHYSAGANYVTTINSLLMAAGIGLINSTPTSLTLATDREDWEIGTDYLTIVNQLLDEISYMPLWFDNNGYAIVKPKPNSLSNPTVQYDFNNIKSLCSDITTTADLFNAPNTFLCVCSNPDNGSWTATATNSNPASPLSTVRRGRSIMTCVKVDNIASEVQLQSYANQLCYDSMFMYQTIEITTGLITGCKLFDTVAVIHDNFHGLCKEVGWTISLEPNGEMRHTLDAMSLNIVG